MRLLSVDWDYFVPSIDQEFIRAESGRRVPYAIGGGEYFSDAQLDGLWDSRAATLLACGISLPRTSGAERTFWSRFRIDQGATLFYADSHAQAAHSAVRDGIDDVWNFDAHHDCGYEGGLEDINMYGWVACANWMCYYLLRGAELRVRYPAWRQDALQREILPLCPVDRAIDNGHAVNESFQVVFVARSGALTPPWLDGALDAFLRTAPVRRRVCLDVAWRPRTMDAAWLTHLQREAVTPLLGLR